jgi:hypothetical protein
MAKQANRKYRIRNWQQYNKALVNRGRVTIWVEESTAKWYETKVSKTRGRPKNYSDDAILCALLLRSVYHLPLRNVEGFLLWIFEVMRLSLSVPCYTQICRRSGELGQQIEKLGKRKPTDIVFDSSGLKVYGEGEWKVRQHGKSKRRTWRKIHLAVCPDSHEIITGYLGENSEADCEVIPKIKEALPRSVKRGYGDGAYDKDPCYRSFQEAGITPIIPPQRGAVLHELSKEPWMKDRNDAIRAIAGLGNDDEARKIWKKLTGYHRRSLGETSFYRWKTIFGGELRSRKMSNQRGEVYAKSIALNKMTRLGMPKGEWLDT